MYRKFNTCDDDLGLVRPDIIPPAVVTTTMKVLKKKFLKCLRVSKFLDIGLLIPDTLTQVLLGALKVVNIGIKITDTLL